MAKLTPIQPWTAELPIRQGQCALAAYDAGSITSISPFNNAHKTVSTALGKALKLSLPGAGKSMKADGATLIWSGRDQYFLLNAKPPKLKAAVTDQTDAWCVVGLSGATAPDVLARLCPLDFAQMEDGDVARSIIGHLQAVILKQADVFVLMVFRGFAETLIHELKGVMTSVAAQNEIPQ